MLKTRMCNRYGTPEGCRFGDKCHFAHSEKELQQGNAPAHDTSRVGSYGRPGAGGLNRRIGGFPSQREPTPPGMVVAVSFGLTSTAKISVDASVAGAIIGKGRFMSRRLQSELMALMMSGDPRVLAFPEADNMYSWVGMINGVQNMVYEGLVYKLSLRFPTEYPFKPPQVKFEKDCYHPNIDRVGNICLDILQDKWSSSYDV